jgi:hypothetical protein
MSGLLGQEDANPYVGGLLGIRGNSIYGVPIRGKLFAGEEEYFKGNPHVAGMAADDDQIVLNPYSQLNEKEMDAVMQNEAARVHMRTGTVPPPLFSLSPEQEQAFKGYGNNAVDRASTVAARIFSNDPSALNPTAEQLEYVKQLRKAMPLRGLLGAEASR